MMKQGNAGRCRDRNSGGNIFSEHPAVVIDRNVSAADRPVINAFMRYQ
jgi:hypothetical protein